jgi:hypothetical protein
MKPDVARTVRLVEWSATLAARCYRAIAQSKSVVRYVRIQRELRERQRKNAPTRAGLVRKQVRSS